MKTILRYSLLAALCGLAACSVTKRMEKRGQLATSPDPQQLIVDQAADPNTLHINYILQIPGNYVPRKAQVVYQTDLVKDGNRMPVSKVYLNGRTYERMMWREVRFEDRAPDYSDGMMVVSGRDPITVKTSSDMLFEEWMPGAVLEAATRLNLCRDEYLLGKRLLSGGVQYIPLAPGPVIIEPAPEPPKPIILKDEGFVSLTYAVNIYRINPEYGNNAAQLNEMTALLKKILSDSLYTTDKIVITGICSPDGSYAYNTELARNRAGTVREYLISHLNADPRLIQTDYIPEDWEGLRKLVEQSEIANKAAILAIIDSTQAPDAKEAALKRLPQYQILKTTMFPQLRKVKYEIYYTEKVLPK